MNKFGIIDKESIKIDEIEFGNKFIKALLDLVLLLGSLGFIVVGSSSFLNYNLLPFINASSVIFFPQGLIMFFYGFFGLIFSLNQIFISYYKIGNGYNFFNKLNGQMVVYRRRSPFVQSDIYLLYKIVDIVRK